MSGDQENRSLLPGGSPNPSSLGLFNQIRLVLRLLLDKRINIFLKLLPLGALLYFLFPEPPITMLLDDALVIALGIYFFVEVCPDAIVEEHRTILRGESVVEEDTEIVVDAEFREEN